MVPIFLQRFVLPPLNIPNPIEAKQTLLSSSVSSLSLSAPMAAVSLTISRLLSSPTARSLSSTTSLFPAKSISLSSSLSLSSLPLKLHRHPQTRKFSTTTAAPSAAKVHAAISVGDKLPDATLSYLDASDEVQTTTVSGLTKGKKVILFAVPGAFTPTCSQKHVPGFVEKAGELKLKGIDNIACVSVNDAFVMKAWKADLKIGDEVLLLSDGNGEFTKAIGAELDLRDKPVGLGVRSRRYAMLVEDGVVKVLNMEEGGAFTFSGAEDMLKVL